MGLISNLLGNLVGLVTTAPNSSVGLQILGSATVNLATTTPQTIYTAPNGNTNNIAIIGFSARAASLTTAEQTTLYMADGAAQNFGYSELYLDGNMSGASVYTFATVQVATIPWGTSPVVTCQVSPTSNSGSVIVDTIGYSTPQGS